MKITAARVTAAALSVCMTLLLLDSVATLGFPSANSAGDASATLTVAAVTPGASHTG
jgi:hypothetical protein